MKQDNSKRKSTQIRKDKPAKKITLVSNSGSRDNSCIKMFDYLSF